MKGEKKGTTQYRGETLRGNQGRPLSEMISKLKNKD